MHHGASDMQTTQRFCTGLHVLINSIHPDQNVQFNAITSTYHTSIYVRIHCTSHDRSVLPAGSPTEGGSISLILQPVLLHHEQEVEQNGQHTGSLKLSV